MPIQIPGISGMGNIASMSDYNIIEPHVVLWRIRATWQDFEPTPGNYDYSVIEDIVDIVIADDKYLIIQINISPVNIAPSWLFSAPYSVPIVTAPGGQTYPYYLNSTFIARKNAMIDAFRNRIKNTWSLARKNKLVLWFICDGKTGDEGTGIETVLSVTINTVAQPNPNAYAISNDDWSAWKKTNSWPQFYADLAADVPTCLAAINPSNNGENWAWALTNLVNAGLKDGQVTHDYGNIGELYYANRINAITDVIPNTLIFGEFEQINSASWYLISPKQNTLALILSGITHGNCSMNISPATFNEVININNSNDWWMFDFANEFLGLRDATSSDKAFIALRDCLDGVNTTRFPVGTYGAVIDPAQQATFNAQYNAIITSGEPIELQQDQIATITAQHFNDNRRIAINTAFPNLNFAVLDNDNDHDAYHQDGGVYMLGNYGKFITQYDPFNTCTGFARIGATNQAHGRNCCGTDTEMFFFIEDGIVGNNSYNVTFKVWYYDEGTRQWSLNYWNGSLKVNAGTITNTNTNTWIEHTFTLNDFYGGGNIDFTTDFSIKSEDGSITKIEIIRFDKISQNTVGTSGIYILGNNSGTICGGTEIELFTDGVFAVTKVLYSDEALTTIVTGFTFVLNTDNNTIYNLNTSTGVIGASTGLTCTSSAVIGDYKVGNTLSTVCATGTVQYYTDGTFAITKVLYQDIGLTTPVITFDYVVRVATGIIYNLNNTTGVIGVATTGICGGGTLTVARLGNDINTVCTQSTTNVYTNGSPTIGSFVFTDINLTIPLTGFILGVRDSNGRIYELDNATGEVLSQVGICGIGLPVIVTLGNSIPDICNNSTTTVYAIGNFQTGIFLYIDSNITTRVTGFDYAIAPNGVIYNIDNGTGEVLSSTGEICESGVSESFMIGFDVATVCESGTNAILYTSGEFEEGKTLYTDINLTIPFTTYPIIARLSTNFIYEVDEATGEVISNTNTKCNMALKTLTISRLRLQPKPDYNIIASIYWRYHLETTDILLASGITVDPDGYFSPVITLSNLDSSRQYVVITAVNDMCETVAEQYFLLQTNISCPAGFTLSEDQTYCYIIETISATPPTSPENAVSKSFNTYSVCGSYIYDEGYNQNGTGISNMIDENNPFWINWDSGASPVPAICSANNTVDGPLNRCGLWATTTHTNQDIGFAVCINLAETKTYYIGLACDNYGVIKIDGEIIVQQSPSALDAQYGLGSGTSTFWIWHIYPVVISSGLHIIELLGHNISLVAALGAEIYDNTSAEIQAATDYTDLNLIFSTKDYVGTPIQLGTSGIGYSCPSGYSLNTCDSPITCTRIVTVPPIIG